jgi:hypothetical protein
VRILLILLSEEATVDGGLLTLGGFASAYYVFRDASIDLILASRSGGYLFLNNSGIGTPEEIAAARRFQADTPARDELRDTICLDDVHVEDLDGAMCLGPTAGGTASLLSDRAIFLISNLLTLGKPVAATPANIASAVGSGPLIAGDPADSPLHVANALVGALNNAT